MRDETNNEMDLLLRRLGRRQDVFAPDAGDHLDADELSAYAENVLPAPARARYIEHLADCSRCRELAVQLTSSAGVAGAAQTRKVTALSGWRKFLASLFSPMVLRYAAPALGLIVVAVIGVMVMRRNNAPEYVSQVQPNTTQVNDRAVNSPAAPNQYSYDSAPSPTDATANKVAETKSVHQQTDTPAPERSPVAIAQNEPPPKPDSQPAAAAGASATGVSTASAPASAPAPVAKVQAASDDAKRTETDQSRKQQVAEVRVAPSEVSKKEFELGKADNKRAEESAAMRSRPAKNKPTAGEENSGRGAAVGSLQRDGVGREDKDKSAETRVVAGRRFRKEGGVWTDTAYDRSRDIVNVRRGSEHYRTLIGDEPAIKTITDQLDGEIIVVWKGRAYRIH